MDASYVIATVLTCFGIVAWWLFRKWVERWESEVKRWERELGNTRARLDIHAIKHSEQGEINATISTDLKHLTKTTDATAQDVKLLLRANGKHARS